MATGTIATDFVHGGHIKSIKFAPNASQSVQKAGVLADAGTRASMYFYFNALPAATAKFWAVGGGVVLRMTTGGVLQLATNGGAQIGSNGATLSTGKWYRICISDTITSTTVYTFKVFVDTVSSITATNSNAVIAGVGTEAIGNLNTDTTLDFRISDHYIDNSSALTDTGDIYVTAKRPNANGTTNGFTTQIGSGGSGYGTGHSPQVNERALSNTNGWSMVGAGSAVTEEYNIEGASVGDINISTATIVDWLGWADMKSLAGETVQVILDGANTAQAITSTETLYLVVKGSSTYPSGTGADIGITTDTSLTTVSLYECGVVVAYIPAAATTATKFLPMLGVGT